MGADICTDGKLLASLICVSARVDDKPTVAKTLKLLPEAFTQGGVRTMMDFINELLTEGARLRLKVPSDEETANNLSHLIDKYKDDLAEVQGRINSKAGKGGTATSPPVTIRELAARVNMDSSACRRYVLRLGYKPTKQRMADSGFQLALTVTADEARAIQAKRASEGYCEAP